MNELSDQSDLLSGIQDLNYSHSELPFIDGIPE
jgi:hypothetical protein